MSDKATPKAHGEKMQRHVLKTSNHSERVHHGGSAPAKPQAPVEQSKTGETAKA